MRTSLRLFAAGLSTLIAAVFLAAVPFATPAHAITGIHTINIGSVTVAEGDTGTSTVDVPITLNYSPVPGESLSANFKTANISAVAPDDYTAISSQTLTWQFGSNQTQNLTVTIKGDTFREPDEQFAVQFNGTPTGAAAGSEGTVTISNDDGGPTPTLSVALAPGSPALVSAEDDPNGTDTVRTLRVTLVDRDQPVTVNYATVDGTATSDPARGLPDFVKVATASLTFADDGFQDVPITIKGDTLAEPDESFQVIFGGNSNAALAAGSNKTMTLQNNDGSPPTFGFGTAVSQPEGDSGTTVLNATVTLSAAATQPTTVDYATSDVSAIASTQEQKGDYELAKGTLTFAIGQSSKMVPVTINGDLTQEPDETFRITLTNGNNANIATPSQDETILNDDFGQITTGPGAGGGPDVETFGAAGAHLAGFYAYEAAFTGGVHVARGDFFKADGSAGADGVDEIVVGPGRNSRPLVRILALDGTIRASFLAFDEHFPGGVYVAAGNFDGNAANGDELVVGAGPGGGPHVRVLQVKGPGDNILDISNGGFYAYGAQFTGGVRVAAANMSGDAKDEIITGAGAGGGPHVRVFGLGANNSFEPKAGFMAYDPGFTGGVFVAATAGKIVTGAGAGGGPHVRVWNGDGSSAGPGFFAYDPGFTGGVSVAMGNLDNDPAAEIVTGAGAGGGPHVRAFEQDGTPDFGGGFFAYQNFTGGIEVSIGNGGA